MLSQLLPVLTQVVTLVAITLALAAVPWLRARIKNQLAADALSLLSTTAATLVAGAADEVRSAKAQGRADVIPAIRERVLLDLRTMGGDSIARLRSVGGLSADEVDRLVSQMVEAQVEKLRARSTGASVAAVATPDGAAVRLDEVTPRPTVAPPEPIGPRASAQSGRASFSLLVLLVIVAALAAVGAALAGCPQLPPRSGCAEGTQRCDGDRPAVCSATGRWHQAGDLDCAAVGGVCTESGGRAFCAPRTNDAGTASDGGDVR